MTSAQHARTTRPWRRGTAAVLGALIAATVGLIGLSGSADAVSPTVVRSCPLHQPAQADVDLVPWHHEPEV